jgi:S-disulfanyl-L-cysteine oxidoreductase SoxD
VSPCHSSRPPAIRPKRLDTGAAAADHLDAVDAFRHRALTPLIPAAIAVSVAFSASAAQEPTATRTTAAGVYSSEQADRGGTLFELKCETCHGAALDGGTMAPGLKGSEFLSTLEGKPLRRLYSRIISTMPPDDIGGLTESETLALVAFLLRANRYPAGTSALARADDLNGIIVAPPPDAIAGDRIRPVRLRRLRVSAFAEATADPPKHSGGGQADRLRVRSTR